MINIPFSHDLYKHIANLRPNIIIAVRGKRAFKPRYILIGDITKLNWNDLQLIVPGCTTKFTKQVWLYQQIVGEKNHLIELNSCLNEKEHTEIMRYIEIFKNHDCSELFQVNDIITKNQLWDDFTTIRAKNDHGPHKGLLGLLPKYFEVVSSILAVRGMGTPLDRSQHY
ncbi:hypothetical protein [Pseudaeromonas pectinilytica]